jgi:hypothetical protein
MTERAEIARSIQLVFRRAGVSRKGGSWQDEDYNGLRPDLARRAVLR